MKNIKLFLRFALISLLWACEKEDTTPKYTGVDVTKIELTYPTTTPTGGTWDDFTNGYDPDVFVKITEGTTITSDRTENASTGELTWYNNDSPIISYTGINHEVKFEVFDYDNLSSNDLMGTVTLKFGEANSYGNTVTATANGTTVKFTLKWR